VQPDKRKCVLFVLHQPGAEAYFRPVISELHETGWEVAFNQAPQAVLPSVIVVSSSYAEEERRAVEWARDHGVGCAQLIDSWYDYKRRIELTNGPGLLPDQIWIFDELARKSAIADGLPADRLKITGNPAWEAVPALPAAPRSGILIVDQPVGSDLGQRLGYDERDFFQTIGDGLADVAIDTGNVIIAVHPRRSGPVPELGLAAEVSHDARSALLRCGTVIGMFSSLLIDAFLGGRRVVSVQPNAGAADRCVLSTLRFAPRVEIADQLKDAIDRAMPGPQGFEQRFVGSARRVRDALCQLAATVAK